MIIKIDTKRDSKEDILKLIQFLKLLAESGSLNSTSNLPGDVAKTLESNPGIFGMFENTSSSSISQTENEKLADSDTAQKKLEKKFYRIEPY